MIPKTYQPNITCKALDKSDYQLLTDSQDLEFWLDFIGFPKKYREDIMGIILVCKDGDLLAMWLTEWCNYYDQSAVYHPLPYYRLVSWTKRNLPIYWLESNDYYQTN